MPDTKFLLFDIETDGLKPTRIWVVCTRDAETNEEKTYYDTPEDRKRFDVDRRGFTLVGHNVLWFDIPSLNMLWDCRIDPTTVLDTLVVSRLLNSWDYNHHSLAAWGVRLGGEQKREHEDWSKLSTEMVARCQSDVRLTHEIFEFERRFIFDDRLKRACEIEHRAQIICTEMHYNGFGFDLAGCNILRERIETEVTRLSSELQSAFPPRQTISKTILPLPTKTGGINRSNFRWITDGRTPEELGARVGVPFDVYETEVFNPGSTKQCIERLWEFGWKPTEKTKGHIKLERDRQVDPERRKYYKKYGWTISDTNLDTLPKDAPEAAKSLVRWILLTRRLGTLDEWRAAYNPESKSIHGEVKSIGTWTHRASHTNPNTGNITRVTSEFGSEMRSLWRAGPTFRQVGCDAEGIQLRILAHYMGDPEFTQALVSGSSKDGTDVHSLNLRKLGPICKNRDDSKRFIYSWLLGAGVGKTAEVLACSLREAEEARENFLAGYPGLRYVKETLSKRDAKIGHFIGLDGRPVMCDSQHLMISGYLQNGETVVMKYANWLWREKLRKEKMFFQQMNYVHDEWQTRVNDDEAEATYIGLTQADSIRQAGLDLGVNCPLAGSFKIGYNWKDCH